MCYQSASKLKSYNPNNGTSPNIPHSEIFQPLLPKLYSISKQMILIFKDP
ncbi:hypothetical protein LEP1GSC008_4060 [Leptospira kirschneri serovar Bulgarica str. Nikolaevo]|uniref:Uncharacterized protein n=1 Tax=Leptospira kirschneri serovar Bulgarica str. Nikolaevo TaxID=1240687 RepID=M6FC56_9LEPT|nr:hypothetical protein LEP1GSC008_4060 [Leptospira kirschneri serovar Bulgarica str. Nikolaevo]